MTQLIELRCHLDAELKRIEYWRAGPKLKSDADIQAELQPYPFVELDVAPQPPNAAAASREVRSQLYRELARNEPHNVPLNLTSAIGTAVVVVATGLMVSQFWSLIAATLAGVISGFVVASVGFGLTWYTRHRDISEQVDAVYEGQFIRYWNALQKEYATQLAEFQDVQLRKVALWDASECQRVKAFKQVNRDPDQVKANIADALRNHQYISIHSQVFTSDVQLSIVLRLPPINSVIASRTKALSSKTGRVISRTKARALKQWEYETFAAGTSLHAIITILNAAPLCERLQIALFSESKARRCFHVCGETDRAHLPGFSWETVEPISLLRAMGFRVEGSHAKHLTAKPAWLTRLDGVRIET